jgi:hypothetical protein
VVIPNGTREAVVPAGEAAAPQVTAPLVTVPQATAPPSTAVTPRRVAEILWRRWKVCAIFA